MLSDLARKYFDPTGQMYFRWEDDGQALVWDNGATIVFKTELATVMRRLAPECLPPWPAIATLLSACRDNWDEGRSLLSSTAGGESNDGDPTSGSPQWESVLLHQIVDELDAIHGLPQEQRHSLTARCELSAMVFDQQIGIFSEDEALEFAQLVTDGLPAELQPKGGITQLTDGSSTSFESPVTAPAERKLPQSRNTRLQQRRQAISDLVRDLRWLRGITQAIDAETLRRRIKTGIEDNIRPDAAQDSPSAKQFISDLMNDEKLGGVARVAHRLLSIVTLPRRISEPDDLPIGGVSDVTNRGSLDKLVPTELAHDDTTLAVRIATNEAMYFRRESPPAPRSLTRNLLIDVGLTTWGIPRIFATSAAMAMQAACDAQTTFHTFSSGQKISKVDLRSKEGIESQLERLHTDLQPGTSLQQLEEFTTNDTNELSELVVITTDEAAITPEFRRQVEASATDRTVFLLTIHRNGRLEFSECNSRGRRVLRTAKLELDQLLHSQHESAAGKLIKSGTTKDFPAIFSLAEFPLRLSAQAEAAQCFHSPSGFASITRDGRILIWDTPKSGARQLTDQSGQGRILWLGWSADNEPLLAFGTLAVNNIKLVQTHENSVTTKDLLIRDTPRIVSGFAGKVFVVYEGTVDVFTIDQAEPIATVPIPSGMQPGGLSRSLHSPFLSAASRFFVKGQRWYALSPAITGAEFVPLPDVRAQSCFDCRPHGIVAVDGSELQCLWNDQKTRLTAPLAAVSADGQTIRYQHSSGADYISRMKDGRFEAPFSTREGMWELVGGRRPLAARTYRRHIRSIGLLGHSIILTMKKGGRLLVDCDNTMTMRVTDVRPDTLIAEFARTESPAGTSFDLKTVHWNDGSKAILDSRGLLHLISSDMRLPQVTLVLVEGRISGWIEGQGTFGVGYHQPNGQETTPNGDKKQLVAWMKDFTRCLN